MNANVFLTSKDLIPNSSNIRLDFVFKTPVKIPMLDMTTSQKSESEGARHLADLPKTNDWCFWALWAYSPGNNENAFFLERTRVFSHFKR